MSERPRSGGIGAARAGWPATLLAAARAYRDERGWSLLPLWWPRDVGVCACAEGPACPWPGKHPRVEWKALQSERPAPADIETWWRRWPEANIGVITGIVSGLAVPDIDPRNGGTETLVGLDALGLWMPEDSGVVASGGGGLHHYCFLDAPLPTDKPWAGIDVLADPGYAVAPPSLHATGRRYRWVRRGATPLPVVPAWIRLTIEARTAPAPAAIHVGAITGDDLVAAFGARGFYLRPHRSPGWHRVRCPWAHEHSNRDGEALLLEPGSSPAPGWGFRCLHSHCSERHIGAVLDQLAVPRRTSA